MTRLLAAAIAVMMFSAPAIAFAQDTAGSTYSDTAKKAKKHHKAKKAKKSADAAAK